MKVKFKKLHKDAKIPQRADELCGGWDVTVTEIKQFSEDFVICKLGFALEIPAGYKLTLVPRSSFTRYKWILQNSPCLIDASYRGEIQLRFRALPNKTKIESRDLNSFLVDSRSEDCLDLNYVNFPYEIGDRVAQVYLEKVIPIEFEEVEELSETDRGDGGFGSTDK